MSYRSGARLLAVLAVLATATAGGFAAPALAAGTGPASTTIKVQPAKIYTDTGLSVKAGETVTVSAKGRIHFGGGKIANLSPAGIPRGPECAQISVAQPRDTPWPAIRLACWSLIAKVGIGPSAAIGVGDGDSFTAPTTGRLFLGVNDNFVDDNSGAWTAQITIAPPTPVTTTPTTTPAPASGKKKSSSPIGIILGAVVLIAVAALLWFFFAGRKKKDDDDEPAMVAAAAPVVAPESPYTAMAAAPKPEPLPVMVAPPPPSPLPEPEPVAPLTPSAPPQPDSIDVNIFEVEFTNGLTLRVGYNHFPEGTRLQWKVTQGRIPVASGHFLTKGGGSTNHVETMALGVKLDGHDAQPDGADVQFDWTINGVPFRYSVRRDPNC